MCQIKVCLNLIDISCSLFDYLNNDAKIKIHLFSIEYFLLGREVSFETLMEDLKFVVVQKEQFEHKDVIIINIFLQLRSVTNRSQRRKQRH